MPATATYRAIIALLLSTILAAPAPLFAQSRVKVRLEGANSMRNLKRDGENIIRYIGNVRFVHLNTRITCDSAYLNSNQNRFDAYGRVIITQNDTRITGDTLHFDGNTSWATILGHKVVMIDQNSTLTTDRLLYNTQDEYAYFNTGGVMLSDDLKLTSLRGHMYNKINQVIFAHNVVMHNDDGDGFTDSLNYNTRTKVVDYYGPSFMFYDTNFVYCEHGHYNTQLKQAVGRQNSYLLSGTRKLFGDKIFFDDSVGYAQVDGNVVVVDTANKIFVHGQKAQYWEEIKRAKITQNPYVVMVDKEDTLYLKADTLFVDEIPINHTTDTTYNLLRAIGNVKFYRHDVQGMCDSLSLNDLDSILTMYNQPVLWQENHQMTADIIKGYSKNGQIDHVDFTANAFIAMEEEPEIYNQLRGKEIVAKFNKGQLYRVDVEGNGQAIYYMRDRKKITMVNRAESANIVITVKKNKIKRIKFNQKPKSNLYPMKQAKPEDVTLKGMKWLGSERPTDKYQIVPHGFVVQPEETGAQRRQQIWHALQTGQAIPNAEAATNKLNNSKLQPNRQIKNQGEINTSKSDNLKVKHVSGKKIKNI